MLNTYDVLYQYHASPHSWTSLYNSPVQAHKVFNAIMGVMKASPGHAGTVTLFKNGVIETTFTTPEKE